MYYVWPDFGEKTTEHDYIFSSYNLAMFKSQYNNENKL